MMNRIEYLKEEIRKHNYLYYALDSPELSDGAYDALFKELKELESVYPELKTGDSPTVMVGYKGLDQFTPIRALSPMLSIDNVYSRDEFLRFDQSVKSALKCSNDISYIVEPKIDGLAVNLLYINGSLTVASTRGDGLHGDNITDNIRTINDIPTHINSYLSAIEIRGEVYLSKTRFNHLNQQLMLKGEKPFANTRNAAAGSLRQLNSQITKDRQLSFFAYGIGYYSAGKFKTQEQILDSLKTYGFPVSDLVRKAITLDRALAIYEDIMNLRDQLDYDIDGVVYKVNDVSKQTLLGETTRYPKWVIAYKFPAKETVSKILSVDFQIGRTGVLTPVARITPVALHGVTVSNITLHNLHDIRRKDLRIGDTVIIKRAGDVIPAIINKIESLRPEDTEIINPPINCPYCNGEVKVDNEGIFVYCINEQSCMAKIKKQIAHFVSKQGVYIEGIGEELIEKLINNGLVKSSLDLYNLTITQLTNLDGIGVVFATKLITNIANSKTTTLTKIIYALGIPNVGIAIAKELTKHFNTLQELQFTNIEKLITVSLINTSTANRILEYFNNPINAPLLEGLANFTLSNSNQINKPLNGKTYVITGCMSKPRSEIIKEIEDLGGIVKDQVTTHTTAIIVGENAGSKLNKAKTLNIPILSEDKLYQLLNHGGYVC